MRRALAASLLMLASFPLASCAAQEAGAGPILIATRDNSTGSLCAQTNLGDIDPPVDTVSFTWDILANVTNEPVAINRLELDNPIGVRLRSSDVRRDLTTSGLRPYNGEAPAHWAPFRVDPGQKVVLQVDLQLLGQSRGSTGGVWVVGETASGVRFRSHTCFTLAVTPPGGCADNFPPELEATMDQESAHMAKWCNVTERDPTSGRP